MDNILANKDSYTKDSIRAIEAKVEAQKIAFSPLTFQAIQAMRSLSILQIIENSGDEGISIADISKKAGISEYGAGVLCEMALGMGVLRLSKNSTCKKNEKYVLGKIGWMILEDNLTKANFDFVNDICYKGAFYLTESVKTGKPEGLKVFGDKWTTIYEALSSLPDQEKKSWFTFDHFYSDIAFPEALPIVFANKPRHIVDIGGNTAKWSIACCSYNSDVTMTIVDLPGQTAVAEQNARKAGFEQRIHTCNGNILDEQTKLPSKPDAVWMSQFLDCFSLKQITKILRKVHECADKSPEHTTLVYVLEPLWDRQKFIGESYALQATSLYFTCMANGNSKMYRYEELVNAIETAGFELKTAHHNLGSNSYSLLVFKPCGLKQCN